MRRVCLILLLSIMLIFVACEKEKKLSEADAMNTEIDIKTMDINDVFQRISNELQTSYESIGKPKPTWESMDSTRKTAFKVLMQEMPEWPLGVSFSAGTQNDHIRVHIRMNGLDKKDIWKPEIE